MWHASMKVKEREKEKGGITKVCSLAGTYTTHDVLLYNDLETLDGP